MQKNETCWIVCVCVCLTRTYWLVNDVNWSRFLHCLFSFCPIFLIAKHEWLADLFTYLSATQKPSFYNRVFANTRSPKSLFEFVVNVDSSSELIFNGFKSWSTLKTEEEKEKENSSFRPNSSIILETKRHSNKFQ